MRNKEVLNSFSLSPLILSEEGWKDAREVKKGENVFTLNPNTREIEIQEVEDIEETVYSGEVYHIKGRNIDTVVFANQNFITIDRYGISAFVQIKDIYNDRTKYSHSCIPKSGLWKVETPKYFTLKGILNVPKKGNYAIDPEMDSKIDYTTFVQFLGIWLAEGHTSANDHTRVGISQKKESVKVKIRELLSRFPEEMKWKEYISKEGTSSFMLLDHRLYRFLRDNFGTCCYDKKINKEFKNLSADLLDEMIYWFNLGDGRFNTIKQFDKEGNPRNYKVRNIFSTSKQLMLDFNEILLKSGGCGNMNMHIPKKDFLIKDRIIKAENCAPIYFLSIAKTKNIHLDKRFLQIEKIETQNHTITQIKVPNKTLYTMQNEKAFWSGSIN